MINIHHDYILIVSRLKGEKSHRSTCGGLQSDFDDQLTPNWLTDVVTYAKFISSAQLLIKLLLRARNRCCWNWIGGRKRENPTHSRNNCAAALIINSNGQSLPIKVVFAWKELYLLPEPPPSGNDAKVGNEINLNGRVFKRANLSLRNISQNLNAVHTAEK